MRCIRKGSRRWEQNNSPKKEEMLLEESLEKDLKFNRDDIVYFFSEEENEGNDEIKDVLDVMNEAIEINMDGIEKDESEWGEILGILKKKHPEESQSCLSRVNSVKRKSSNVGKVIYDNETMASSK